MIFKKLNYQPDALLQYFSSFSGQPWAVLLHSGFAQHAHNRFDIMAADPLVTLTTSEKNTEIVRHLHMASDVIEKSELDPFMLLNQELNKLNLTAEPQSDLPFLGGALGLFGYDLGRRIERLPEKNQKDIDLPDMAIGIYDWALIADHHKKKLTLVCHNHIELRLQWLEEQKNKASHFTQPFKLNSGWQSSMSRDAYGQKFRQIKKYLHQGDCYQINLAQRFSADYQGDEWQAFLHLSQNNQAPFSAFMRLPNNTVLSLSPERFLYLKNHHIQTRPVKGTLPRLPDKAQDEQQASRLASSKKDRAENLMIVDLLRNDIGRVAQPGTVKVPELFVVETFPAVHHLVSTIAARLRQEYTCTDLLRACFPGGSVTGVPKVRAMEIIEELEPHRRNLYCGNMGYISLCGTMDTNITIRTLLTERGKIHCWAGGAIVADSEEQAEYQETLDKIARILPQLKTGLNK
ncbi:aminodeoxychorismate synthase component I [Candidatus Williamhamiltonella defendens]|nr:aminodeoxychorismate synthase component 1 [Candidatus Hamiltonella defensa]AYB48516.1 aminodeoxychorismate synthase component I [Candidatus Hamiltonella defensa]